MFDFKLIENGLIECDQFRVPELVQDALDQGVSASEILKEGLISGMEIVGEKMETGDMFIPEVLRAAKIMNDALEILKPLLGDNEISTRGKVIIGTVKGDLHDIGKNLVAMMLESGSFEVYNLGVDISPDQFVAKIEEKTAEILCISALLTTTLPMMKQTINAVVESGLRGRIKIMVGGAPVTQGFADEIGADGYCPNAGSAVKMVKTLSQ